MSDPDLKREINSIINHLDDASISLINSGFGFSKTDRKQYLQTQIVIGRQSVKADPSRSNPVPQPIATPKLRETFSQSAQATAINRAASRKKITQQHKRKAQAPRRSARKESSVTRVLRGLLAHTLDLALISAFLFGSLFMVFKVLNNKSDLLQTLQNLTRFMGEQVDPLIGVGMVYLFSLFYYLFFFGFKATPIGAYLLKPRASKK